MAIEYNDDDMITGNNRPIQIKRPKGFIGFMVRRGWVKNKSEGTAIMLIIIITIGIITLVIQINRDASKERDPAIESILPSVQQKLPESIKKNLR